MLAPAATLTSLAATPAGRFNPAQDVPYYRLSGAQVLAQFMWEANEHKS